MSFSLAVLTAGLLLAHGIAGTSAEARNSTEPRSPGNRGEETDGSPCVHKDYRSYVKCLLSQRRYESPRATGRPNGGVECVEECERESCRRHSPDSCAELCRGRCLRKTKEIHHRITEYETDCNDDDDDDVGGCGRRSKSREPATVANLTTSIDIRNYVNNTNVVLGAPRGSGSWERSDDATGVRQGRNRTAVCAHGDSGCSDGGNEDVNRRPATPPRPPQLPGLQQAWFPGAGLALVPQIQLVPQVTFGLGIGPGGLGFAAGCPYASVWLCLPQERQRQQIPDCSGCDRPRGGCDPSC